MIFKNMIKLTIVIFIFLFLSACSENKNRLADANKSNVGKVLEDQINNAEKSNNPDKNSENQNNEDNSSESKSPDGSDSENQGSSNKKDNANSDNKNTSNENSSESDIDYDLTTMSAEMVYATVYQLIVYPEEYIGKKVKIKGEYYAASSEDGQKKYHYVIVADAAACCAQGIEFVWGDGSHVYPDDYPEDETEVEVVGIFETYIDEDDDYLYCRLVNSTMEIVE